MSGDQQQQQNVSQVRKYERNVITVSSLFKVQMQIWPEQNLLWLKQWHTQK